MHIKSEASKEGVLSDIKILFLPCHYVFDQLRYGSEQNAAFNIADRLARRYPQSLIVTGKKVVSKEPKYRIIEVQRKASGYDMSAPKAALFNLRYTLAGVRILSKERFDIIHHVRPFQLGYTFNLLAILNLTRKSPFVIGSFCSPYKNSDPANYVKKSPIKQGAVVLLEKALKPLTSYLSIQTLKKASLVFVYDNFTKSLVSKHIQHKRVIIIPPGKDKLKYTYSAEKKFTGNIELISVGYLIPRKGFDLLINAMKKIVKNHPKVKLRIVGNGQEEQRLREQISDLKLEDNVILHGFVPNEEIQKLYSKANFFVSMQREESFGQVFIEALASGLPIVTTSTIGSREIIQSEKLGYVVEQGDVDSLSNKVSYLIQNPDKAKKISAYSRKHFESHYDWDILIDKYVRAYESLLPEVPTSHR